MSPEPGAGPVVGRPAIPGYEVLGRLGSGATGTVWKGREAATGRVVALKILHPEFARERRFKARLGREASVAERLDHPGIVRGLGHGEADGVPFLVLEFVEGKSLKALLRERGTLSESEVLTIGTQLAEALAHAHARGVVHRDVKPGNVLLERSGRARLTDFGLARAPLDATITREGATLGTPQYLAPEQARDVATADLRSDLYGLGATLHHAATGRPPFEGERIADVLTRVLFEPAPDPATVRPDLSPGLCLVLRKLLLKNPARRYPSAEALLADLHAVARLERPSVEPSAVVEEPGRRGSKAVRAAIGVALVAGGAAAFALLRGGRVHAPDPAASTPPGVSASAEVAAALAADPLDAVARLRATLERKDLSPALREDVEAALRTVGARADASVRAALDALARAVRRGEGEGRFGAEEELFERVLPAIVRETLGVPLESVPEPFAGRLTAAIERERAAYLGKGRDAARRLRDDFERFAREILGPEVVALSQRNDFVRALERLDAGLESFRGAGGVAPADLPREESESLRESIDATRRDLRESVRRRAVEKAGEGSEAVRSVRTRIEAELAQGRAPAAVEAYDREARALLLEKGIDPGAFPPDLEPDLPDRMREDREALGRLATRAAEEAAARLFEELARDLDARVARREFEATATAWREALGREGFAPFGDAIRERLDEAEALLGVRNRFADAVDAAVDTVVELRAGGITHAGKVARRYDRERDEVELLRPGRSSVVLPFRDLHPDAVDLLLAWVDPMTRRERTGLGADDAFARGLFRLRGGDPAEGERLLRLLPADARARRALARFETEAKPAPTREPSRSELALGAIREARDLRRAGDLSRARASYARCLREFADVPEVSGEEAALKAELAETEEALARRGREERLRRFLPDGAVVWSERGLALAFSFALGAPRGWTVPGSWEPGDGGLRRTAAAAEGPLDAPGPFLQVPLDAAGGFRVSFRLAFPYEAGRPGPLALVAGGHAFVVRPAGTGSEIAHARADLDSIEDAFRTHGALRPRRTPHALARGASYEIAVEVAEGGRRARLLVDGGEWGSGERDGATDGRGIEVRGAVGTVLREARIEGVLESALPK